MGLDLSWLIGRRLKSLDKKDYSWFFVFDDESHIDTESPWRLVLERVVVTSGDHGHLFGLPAPVDASEVVRQSIGHSAVDRVELDPRTGDLSLYFSNGATLQFLTLSGGFEGWRIGRPHQLVICLGGGELAIMDAEPTKQVQCQTE